MTGRGTRPRRHLVPSSHRRRGLDGTKAFIGEVIQAAQAAGTHTGFLRVLDERVAAWAAATDALVQHVARAEGAGRPH
ncbi:hypothetical protein ACNPQM_30810, partial [Streptomyces sp. NPDC056231]|uniref:hypothetical protein n=1 Tax=Streptomyces sp. NPDC056231 TaxID=3345755 RepID=UPI003AAABC48